MKDFQITSTRSSLFTLVIALASLTLQAQDHYTQSGTTKMSIEGTSTLHEWTMKSGEATYDAVFEINTQGVPVKLTSLIVSVPAESLKSGKVAMDKNAYAALRTDKNKEIMFQLVAANMVGKSIQCTGKLTIAGTTKQVDVEVVYTSVNSYSVSCSGTKKVLMTDYNVEPPSFMFGTVTTGNEITISFEVILASKKLQPITLK